MSELLFCALGLTGIILNKENLKTDCLSKWIISAIMLFVSSFVLFNGIERILKDMIIFLIKNIQCII